MTDDMLKSSHYTTGSIGHIAFHFMIGNVNITDSSYIWQRLQRQTTNSIQQTLEVNLKSRVSDKFRVENCVRETIQHYMSTICLFPETSELGGRSSKFYYLDWG
jgi:hypothetical protein